MAEKTHRQPVDWAAVRAVFAKDVTAVRRSKAIVLPMLIVPFLLLVVLPLFIGLAAKSVSSPNVTSFLEKLPHSVARPILGLPPREQLVVLVLGYLLAPLFLIVPLMLSSVLAADAFAGEKERRTLETMLLLPIADGPLFYAKVLAAFLPAMMISWVGFILYAIVANAVGWSATHRIFV